MLCTEYVAIESMLERESEYDHRTDMRLGVSVCVCVCVSVSVCVSVCKFGQLTSVSYKMGVLCSTVIIKFHSCSSYQQQANRNGTKAETKLGDLLWHGQASTHSHTHTHTRTHTRTHTHTRAEMKASRSQIRHNLPSGRESKERRLLAGTSFRCAGAVQFAFGQTPHTPTGRKRAPVHDDGADAAALHAPLASMPVAGG